MAKRLAIASPIDEAFSIRRIVGSGVAASIDRGTPTKEGSAGAVAIMVDGDLTTSQRFSGLAKTVSTDTVAAAGIVNVWLPLPGIKYVGSPKTAGACDTQAEIDALAGQRVPLDLTSSDWTVDTAAGDGATNGAVMIGGQPEQDLIYFWVSESCSVFE